MGKMWSLNDMARFSTAQRKTARSEMTQYRDVLTGSRGKSRRKIASISIQTDTVSTQSRESEWWVRFSHTRLTVTVTTACHCQCQSWVRDMVRVRDRDTRTATGTVTVTETATAGCLLLYRNLPVSIPNSNVYARRYFFAFWPPCCIRFQLVWPYLTEKCAALDITIARFHCIQRVPNKICLPDSTS